MDKSSIGNNNNSLINPHQSQLILNTTINEDEAKSAMYMTAHEIEESKSGVPLNHNTSSMN